jgi:hypothetical protein
MPGRDVETTINERTNERRLEFRRQSWSAFQGDTRISYNQKPRPRFTNEMKRMEWTVWCYQPSEFDVLNSFYCHEYMAYRRIGL